MRTLGMLSYRRDSSDFRSVFNQEENKCLWTATATPFRVLGSGLKV